MLDRRERLANRVADRRLLKLISPLPGVDVAGRRTDDDDALPPAAVDDDIGLDGDINMSICNSSTEASAAAV